MPFEKTIVCCLGPKKIAIVFGCFRGSQNIDSEIIKIPKFQNCHFMVFNRYWYHISKIPFIFFDRYWSHIQDFEDFIKRILILVRCPSFQNLTFFWKLKYVRIIFFYDFPILFLVCLKHFYIKKEVKMSMFGEHVGSSKNDPKSIEICPGPLLAIWE